MFKFICICDNQKRANSNQNSIDKRQSKKYYKDKLKRIMDSQVTTRNKINLVQMLKLDIQRQIDYKKDNEIQALTMNALKKEIKLSYRRIYDQIQPKCHSLVKIRNQFCKKQQRSKSACRQTKQLQNINIELKKQLRKMTQILKEVQSNYQKLKLTNKLSFLTQQNSLINRTKISVVKHKKEIKQAKDRNKSKQAKSQEFSSALKRIRAL